MNHSKSFRIAAKKVFLTFPNMETDLDFQNIFDTIAYKIQALKSVIIAKERHVNDVLHYHIFIESQNKFDTENPNFFDFIFNKHGNYQSVKNFKQTINYLKKENNYREFLSEYTEDSGSLTRQIRKDVERENCKPLDLLDKENEAYRDMVFTQATKIDTYYKRVEAHRHEKELKTKHHIEGWDLYKLKENKNEKLKPYIKNLLPILLFCNQNMVKEKRRYKSPNLLIWSSAPDLGKSSLMNMLAQITPTYQWPTDNWYELYSNNLLQFILWDEFTLIGHSQEFMKLLFTGGPLKLPIKGSQIFKKDNPLIFCGSNYSLREHVIRKYSIACHCDLPNSRTLNSKPTPLCLGKHNCNTSQSALLYYDALCARIQEFKLPGPLFPNGTSDPELWTALKSSLTEAISPCRQDLPLDAYNKLMDELLAELYPHYNAAAPKTAFYCSLFMGRSA